MTVNHEQIRRDANYWINQTQLGPETPGNHLALYCLALLAELEQADTLINDLRALIAQPSGEGTWKTEARKHLAELEERA